MKPDRFQWQQEALDQYLTSNKQDFLAVATPGAGKTRFGLRVAAALFQKKEINGLIIVSPSSEIKDRWKDDAATFGIQLEIGTSRYNNEFHGLSTTYQEVSCSSQFFKAFCSNKRTLVIFDEVHHAGEDADWGAKVSYAFEPAKRRLSLSGTPFRSKVNSPISFVQYEDDMSVSDYEYDYARALEDGVVRSLIFPAYDGNMEWALDGKTKSATFKDEVSARFASMRLRTALRPDQDVFTKMFLNANAKLMALRIKGDSTACGLVIAMDTAHAEKIAARITELISEPPCLVYSDLPGASAKLRSFRRAKANPTSLNSPNPDTRARWIVCVRMVSEGVDIPQLRVLVFATNITERLFFYQASGRVVRAGNRGDREAYVFLPDDKRLIIHAEEIKRARNHVLGPPQLEEDEELLDEPSIRSDRQGSFFEPLAASNSEVSRVVADGIQWGAAEFARNEQPMSLSDEKKSLRGQEEALKKKLLAIRVKNKRISGPMGAAMRQLNIDLVKAIGYKGEGTAADLKRRISMIQKWVTEEERRRR